jgi:hypothetical protein
MCRDKEQWMRSRQTQVSIITTRSSVFHPLFDGQIMKPDTSLNNQEYRQLQEEKKSMCTPHVHSNETICASNHFQSPVKKQTSQITTLHQVPKDDKPKSPIEETSKSRNGLSREVKQNLQVLIKFRRQKRIRGKYPDQYP